MYTRRHTVLVAAAAVGLQVFNGYTIYGPVSVADLALVTALGVTGFYQLYTRDAWLASGTRPLAIPFAGLLIWLIFAGRGWHATQFFAFVLVIALTGLTVRSVDDIQTLLWGALAGAVAASVLTLFSIFVSPEFGGRVAGSRGIGPLPELPRTVGVPIGSFGAFATYALAPVGWAAARWYRTRDRRLLVAVAVVVFMIIVHQTRATYLALAALAGVLILGLFGRQLWRAGWRNASLGLGSAIGVAAVAGASAWTLYLVNPANAIKRFLQYERAFQLLLTNPLTGIVPPLDPYFFSLPGANIPHNVILLVAVVGGVPALALLLTTFAVAASGLWTAVTDDSQQISTVGLGIAAGWAATLTNLSLAPGFTRAFWLLIALGATLLCRRGTQLKPVTSMSPAVRNSVLSRVVQTVPWSRTAAVIRADASTTRVKVENAYLQSTIRRFLLKIETGIRNSRISAYLLGEN